MQDEREKRLLGILQAGRWTEDELAWFMKEWDRDEEGWMKRVLRAEFDASTRATSTASDPEGEALLEKLHERMGPGPVRVLWSRFSRMAVAASLMLGLFGAMYLWMTGRKTSVVETASRLPAKPADIGPGADRALLILPGGRTIHLDVLKGGIVNVGEKGLNVRLQDGGIRYSASEELPLSMDVAIPHSIETPRGGQYRLILSDGTRVWLNSSSSIRFPAVFSGGERRIAITGEAYLEVARDEARPFWVDVDGRGLVRVVGTRFNVQAYRDEPSLDITLIEGSVKVGRMADAEMVSLKPGQQARLTGATGPMVSVIDDMQRLVAWKDGKFQFGEGVELSAVLRLLERWYDVEFRFEGEVRGRVGGSISRDVNLSQVLDLIGLTGVARFSREGRVVRVSKPG